MPRKKVSKPKIEIITTPDPPTPEELDRVMEVPCACERTAAMTITPESPLGCMTGDVKPDALRKHVWAAAATICCFVLLQVGTLIYWAGSISSRVGLMERAIDRVDERLRKLERTTERNAMTAPSGCLSLAQENLRITLADVTAFRTWTDSDNQAEALARIYHEGLPLPTDKKAFTAAELETLRPYAIIFGARQQSFSREVEAIGSSFDFSAQGTLTLRLYQTCPEALDDDPTSDANLQWRNTIGEIIDGLCALAGQGGYLAFDRISVDEGPYWAHPSLVPDEGLWQGVDLSLHWSGV